MTSYLYSTVCMHIFFLLCHVHILLVTFTVGCFVLLYSLTRSLAIWSFEGCPEMWARYVQTEI